MGGTGPSHRGSVIRRVFSGLQAVAGLARAAEGEEQVTDYFNSAKRWNLMHGCQRVSPGCQGCWAERMATRHCNASTRGGRWTGEVVLFPERLAQPLHWHKPAVIAVQFMGDLFYERVPFEFVAAVFGVMAACPQHTFLLLTKRPERMLEFHRWLGVQHSGSLSWRCIEYADDHIPGLSESLSGRLPWPLPNAWLGISAENQVEIEKRWTMLRQVPAAHYWLSAEPLLSDLNLEQAIHRCHSGQDGECTWKHCPQLRDGEPEKSGRHCPLDDDLRDDAIDPAPPRLGFVAVGPETGQHARPCDPEWIRSVVLQCRDARVPVHVKAVPVCKLGRECMHVPGVCKQVVSKKPSEWAEDLRVQDEVPRA